MNKWKDYVLWWIPFIMAGIIYFYFLPVKTTVIYGDDVRNYMLHEGLSGFFDKINMELAFKKFRPIHGLSTHLVIYFFQKNLYYYYLFNVGVQTLNALLFAMLLNLFLKARWLSLFFSLLVALSRFSVFNMNQLLNGGVLEGLAKTFFFLSLFFILKTLMDPDPDVSKKMKRMILSILFANLSMYTHERYIMIFPFILLLLLFYPGLRSMAFRQRLLLLSMVGASMILNIAIKKYMFSIPFFMGTANTPISFSLSQSLTFFMHAVAMILHINNFLYLSLPQKALILVLFTWFTGVFWNYLRRPAPERLIFLFLAGLFILLLIPAVVTVVLSDRWLQASFNVFILMIAMALPEMRAANKVFGRFSAPVFILLLLWIDYTSYHFNNVKRDDSKKVHFIFERAIRNGIIRENAEKLVIVGTYGNVYDPEIRWKLGHGAFFGFYQHKSKQLIFTDSLSKVSFLPPFPPFDRNTWQVISIRDEIKDLTKEIPPPASAPYNQASFPGDGFQWPAR